MTLKFDHEYQEVLRLPSGERLRARLVLPSDRERLLQGFESLSAASRYRRFLSGKPALSDDELRYFTEVDQVDHFAIGVVELTATGEEGQGAGIGRFIRQAADADCAEVAITVVDRMQGKGIGRILLERLIGAASERGIKRFRFECLPHNQQMQKLVQGVCRVVQYENDADLMIAEADLPGVHLGSREQSLAAYGRLFELLRAFAAETLELQVSLGLETMHRTLDRTFARES